MGEWACEVGGKVGESVGEEVVGEEIPFTSKFVNL